MVSAARRGLRDAAKAHKTQRLARNVLAQQMGRAPTGPATGAQLALAFAGAPRRHQHQQDSKVSRRVGQDVGRIGYRYCPRRGGIDVDVVEANAEVADQPYA